MLFIGYSSKDRYDIVEPMVFHLKNYGINVWYDFHDMFLSDNRLSTNFEIGIGGSKYVIFIISNNFFCSNCAIEELRYAQLLYEKNEIVLFPILYKINAFDLPEEYNWIKKIIYNKVNEHSGTLFVTNQIIEKMLHDETVNLPMRSFEEILKYLSKSSVTYLYKLIETYINLDIPNYSSKASVLYAIYLYITLDKQIEYSLYVNKIVNRIFKFTSLNITLDHLTFSIFHLTMLIAINKYISFFDK